jgi:hypothetical protein
VGERLTRAKWLTENGFRRLYAALRLVEFVTLCGTHFQAGLMQVKSVSAAGQY